MPLARVLLAIFVAAALALPSGGCGLFGGDAVVLVSGRDDHGDLLRPHLGLQRSPTDTEIAATARDGDLAWVRERRGPWTRVALVRTSEEGWIEDHYLRGEAVYQGDRPRRVRFVTAERRSGEIYVRVRYADDGSEAWVNPAGLKEVGAR